jgi:hypothetical protein
MCAGRPVETTRLGTAHRETTAPQVAADAALELLIVRAELGRRAQGSADSPETQRLLDELFDLDRAWRAYVYDTQRSDGSDWDYNGHEVGLGVQTPLWAGITLDVHGSYYRFNYQSVNSFSCCTDARGGLGDLNLDPASPSFDTQVRTDNRFTGGIALSRDVGPYVTLSAGYVHIRNHSNIAFFDYSRNLVTLAVSGTTPAWRITLMNSCATSP